MRLLESMISSVGWLLMVMYPMTSLVGVFFIKDFSNLFGGFASELERMFNSVFHDDLVPFCVSIPSLSYVLVVLSNQKHYELHHTNALLPYIRARPHPYSMLTFVFLKPIIRHHPLNHPILHTLRFRDTQHINPYHQNHHHETNQGT